MMKRRKVPTGITVVIVVLGVPVAGLILGWLVVTQPLYLVTTGEPAPPADPVRLERDVRALSEGLGPRNHLNPDNLERVAEFIRQELALTGASLTDQPFEVGGHTYRNVMAAFGPDTAGRVVVGAHYDVWEQHPGADDNASGVAGLLELGRMLQRFPPRSRVELAAYCLEEPPHYAEKTMGSAVHAASLRRSRIRVRAMIALEMIGYFDDEPDSQRYPAPFMDWFYPREGDFIAVVGKLGQGWIVRRVKASMRGGASLPVFSINAPRLVPGIDFSDHRSFWNEGYPAVMITDTAFFRNPFYHTIRDIPDTLDFHRMAQVVDGVHAAVLSLADGG
jgi:hypothetical protein